jgi:hypothetical protein
MTCAKVLLHVGTLWLVKSFGLWKEVVSFPAFNKGSVATVLSLFYTFVIQFSISDLDEREYKRQITMVSGGMTCVKYLLFVFNLLFAVCESISRMLQFELM